MSASGTHLRVVAEADSHALALHGILQRPMVLQGPRLQVQVGPAGLSRGSLWAGGALPDLRFDPPLPADTRWTLTPNRACARWSDGALCVALVHEEPVLALHGEGALPRLRCSGGRSGVWRHEADLSSWDGPGASLRLHLPGAPAAERGVRTAGEVRRGLIAVGATRDEAEAALQRVLALPDPYRALRSYHAELAAVLRLADPLLQSLFLHGLHTAASAERRHPDGRFAGFAAGFGYVEPARTYYRDAYWTLQVLLPLRPELAMAQLRLLAREVDAEGGAPSGVIVAEGESAARWAARRARDPALAHDHPRDGVWWADHSDSPLYFVLLAAEVARWGGWGEGLLEEGDLDRRVRASIAGLVRRLDPEGLPIKPVHDRDWADNVFRSGAVTYLVALAHGALQGAAELYARRDPAFASGCRQRAAQLRSAADRRLWQPELGHYAEFVTADGVRAEQLAIDTTTALRFDLADAPRADAILAAMRDRLESRHQRDQPWGDWGVASLHPLYPAWVRRRGKSRFPHRYHNGGAWPIWSGVLAEAQLLRRSPDWHYPLTRAWSYGLAQGWPNPVEYHSPPYPPGSPVNGWSAMPAAAMLLGGFGLTPAGPRHAPPWGASQLTLPRPGGGELRVICADENLEVHTDG
jgi:hypothetical protein